MVLDAVAACAAARGRTRGEHFSASDLCRRLVQDAVAAYGPYAKRMLLHWGIRDSRDIGAIVFELAERGLLSVSSEDTPEAFADALDLDSAMGDAPASDGADRPPMPTLHWK